MEKIQSNFSPVIPELLVFSALIYLIAYTGFCISFNLILDVPAIISFFRFSFPVVVEL